jgi:hypothetical protein
MAWKIVSAKLLRALPSPSVPPSCRLLHPTSSLPLPPPPLPMLAPISQPNNGCLPTNPEPKDKIPKTKVHRYMIEKDKKHTVANLIEIHGNLWTST